MQNKPPEGTSGLTYGTYQGLHWRRVARCGMAIVLGILYAHAVVVILGGESTEKVLRTIAIFIVVIAICDWWFARRMGFALDQDGLTLRYSYKKVCVSWSQIQGFQWKKKRTSRTEFLWAEIADGNIVRIPTVGRVSRALLLAPFLTSTDIRSTTGEVLDAMATLEHALKAAKNSGHRPHTLEA